MIISIEKYIDWCESGRLDLKIITYHSGQNTRDAKRLHKIYTARIKQCKENTHWQELRLPPKNTIENWTNPQIIVKLMNKNV
ncbi:MAG: hypothetical protein ORN24_04660 [Burkholderiales bacterium]|nr:hypothetical protein [Burkholderiales bacterium]